MSADAPITFEVTWSDLEPLRIASTAVSMFFGDGELDEGSRDRFEVVGSDADAAELIASEAYRDGTIDWVGSTYVSALLLARSYRASGLRADILVDLSGYSVALEHETSWAVISDRSTAT